MYVYTDIITKFALTCQSQLALQLDAPLVSRSLRLGFTYEGWGGIYRYEYVYHDSDMVLYIPPSIATVLT